MNKLQLALAGLLLPLSASAASVDSPVSVDYRCLTESTAQSIHLEWRMFSDPNSNWSGGYVRYKGSTRVITIVPVKREVGDKPEGRPWEYITTWAEIVDGRIEGQYVVTTQGANIYGFDYKNLRSGKQYSFSQDIGPDDGKKCSW
ncbi:MAG TPA: hypothetical protein VF555_00095 [Variovorax sp.]